MSDFAKELFMRLVAADGLELSDDALDRLVAYAVRCELATERQYRKQATSR